MNGLYDVIIAGAGSMGMAAGYYLAKQGRKTLLLDANDPPHTVGSHHGDTRIIRHAYGEGKQYVPIVLRAQQLWLELEQEAEISLFRQTGVLSVGASDSPFLKEVKESAATFSLPLEVLNAEVIQIRWPGITVPDDFLGCFENASGFLFSEQCIRAYRNRAVALGADIRPNSPVTDIEVKSDGVVVHCGEKRYSGDSLILSAGAWSGKLSASLDLSLPLTPTRKTIGWFEANEQLYGAAHFPAFIFDLKTSTYYGFPSFNSCGVKVGRHDGGQAVNPDNMNREFGSLPEDEGDLRSFLTACMPQAAGALKQGKVCLYTMTPDEHFIIDRHPAYPHVVITAGFSGHGFKFVSAVGEAASQLVTSGKVEHDVSLFSLKRFFSIP
ncbi:N-methyl-L-tryptophan oxidase [Paenibacillus alkalitolerans]|uniref:N-methyl-L-tryptophan oxidase n=1 Tax=Paenibacillus alkalitolerans TaxID=2799335 RepID=UPI0018F53E03|nr:N-methyl-L-tryptophan oxidase [Paenibacillus alkalitolerans]